MLATHTIDPEELHTITAGGFSATADAFARDADTQTLWFLSMVGSQTALKAIWASMLKQPPDDAHIIRGADGMALSGGYQRCIIPYETIGTWTDEDSPPAGLRRLARPGLRAPSNGAWNPRIIGRDSENVPGSTDLPLRRKPRGTTACR